LSGSANASSRASGGSGVPGVTGPDGVTKRFVVGSPNGRSACLLNLWLGSARPKGEPGPPEQDCYPDHQKMLDSVTADDRARRERANVADFFRAAGQIKDYFRLWGLMHDDDCLSPPDRRGRQAGCRRPATPNHNALEGPPWLRSDTSSKPALRRPLDRQHGRSASSSRSGRANSASYRKTRPWSELQLPKTRFSAQCCSRIKSVPRAVGLGCPFSRGNISARSYLRGSQRARCTNGILAPGHLSPGRLRL
jgi:hypothetical protein